MAKTPKAPKGGASKVKTSHQPQPGTVTAEQMFHETHAYEHLMYKPNRVKSPEDMPVNESFLGQLDLIRSFADLDIKAPVFDKYATTYSGHETYGECMELSHDNMLMILLEAYSMASTFSDMDDPYDRGFCNILKAMVALYSGNPYTRDRIGWLMWLFAKHISPSCYFPLTLDLYYDPRLWHRPGEQPKPPLPIPQSYAFDGQGQTFGPEDDIWDCELPNSGSGE